MHIANILCVLQEQIFTNFDFRLHHREQNFRAFLASFSLVFDRRNLYRATRDVHVILSCLFYLQKSTERWTERNMQLTFFFCSSQESFLSMVVIKFTQNAETVHYVVIVKRRVLIFLFQST